MQKKLKKKLQDTKEEVPAGRKKKVDPLFEIEGNQNLGKIMKLQLKKKKKEQARRGTKKVYSNIQYDYIIKSFKTSFY